VKNQDPLSVMSHHEILTNEDQVILLNKWRDNHDIDSRNQLVGMNIRLIHHVLRNMLGFKPDTGHYKDCISEGVLAIMRCCDKFDLNFGSSFSSYIQSAIRFSVIKYLSEHGCAVRFPQDVSMKLHKEELADFETEGIYDRLQDGGHKTTSPVVSLQSYDDNEDHYNPLASKVVTNPAPCQIDKGDELSLLREELQNLSERERHILTLRFDLDDTGKKKTLLEVSNLFNLSHERIRQIEESALLKMRKKMQNFYE